MITGIKYRIINAHNFFIFAKDGEPSEISAVALSTPHIQPIKMDNINAPNANENVPNKKLIWLKKSGEARRAGIHPKSVKNSLAP